MAKHKEDLPKRQAPQSMKFGQTQKPDSPQAQPIIMEQAQPTQVQIQSQSSPDQIQMPPPAQPLPPGMQGTPPLPVGVPVSTKSYTASELATLKTIPGWNEGDPVPSDMAETIANLGQEAVVSATNTDRMRPPIAMDTPPLVVPKPVDISQLPPEKRAEVQAHFDRAKEAEAERARLGALPQTQDPSVKAAILGQNVTHVPLVDDRKQATYAGTDVSKSEPAPAQGIQSDQAQAPTTEDTTGANTPVLTKCPHCEWDLSVTDDSMPSESDKQRFLMAQMGGIAFQKSYTLLGGNLIVEYRELTPKEVNALYKQVYAERTRGEVVEPMDFIEAIMQYRMCLALVVFKTSEQSHEFPSDLSGWAGEEEEGEPTLLPSIHKAVYDAVIKTESLNRILAGTLAHFGRILAKMEGNVENPDFWEQTEQEPS